MPGASDATRRVAVINANFTASSLDGSFEFLVVTEDGVRHTLPCSAASATAIIALTQATDVLLFDPAGPTLIAANVKGQWLPDDWSGTKT